MPTRLRCPGCSSTLEIADRVFARAFTCPKCKTQLRVPDRPKTALVADDSEPPGIASAPPPRPRARPPLPAAPPRLPPADNYRDEPGRFELSMHGPVKPSAVGTAGTCMLSGGIVAVAWALVVMLLDVVLTVGLCCLYPGWLYAIVSGVLAIIRGSFLIGANAHASGASRWAAIMLIINVVNLDPVSATLGILSLVYLSGPDVNRYFGQR